MPASRYRPACSASVFFHEKQTRLWNRGTVGQTDRLVRGEPVGFWLRVKTRVPRRAVQVEWSPQSDCRPVPTSCDRELPVLEEEGHALNGEGMVQYQWGSFACGHCRHSFGPHVLLDGRTIDCPECGTLQTVLKRPTGIAKAERQRQAEYAQRGAPQRRARQLKTKLILAVVTVLVFQFVMCSGCPGCFYWN